MLQDGIGPPNGSKYEFNEWKKIIIHSTSEPVFKIYFKKYKRLYFNILKNPIKNRKGYSKDYCHMDK